MESQTGLLIRFALFFATVSGILCTVVYKILKRRLGMGAGANQALLVFLCFTFLVMVIAPIRYRLTLAKPDGAFDFAFQFTQYYLMGFVGVLFIGLTVAEALNMLACVFDPSKRDFLTVGVSRGIAGGLALSTGVGLVQAMRGPSIHPVTIKIKTLPPAFHGLKITQISDVHIGPMLHRDFLINVVNQVNSTQPDLIFITGDLVDGTVDQLRNHIEPLRDLRAKDGVYFCTGNHEYYSGAPEWIQHLETFGIHVFKNSNIILKRGNATEAEQRILIGGVYDFQAGRYSGDHKSDCSAAAACEVTVGAKLLLAHNPYSIDDAAKAGFDVQFSGHTHAGQFYPFAWITRIVLKHVEGLYQINDQTQLYVNRGTGYWGPPNRLGKPGEITAFRLEA